MSRQRSSAPLPVIFGCAGTELTPDERDFFRKKSRSSGTELTPDERDFFRNCDPLGFILFGRNVEAPEQVKRLIGGLRDTVGRADAPVLIDQEGGRVARLRPPHWRKTEPAEKFGRLAAADRASGVRASWLNAFLLGAELRALGITVDCAPVLDLRFPGAHDVIGDRSFSEDPELVAVLGRAACEGFFEAGILPVIKHLPGHGRVRVDSHETLPTVDATVEALRDADFKPFHALSDMPAAMTAHIVFRHLDPNGPATTSPYVIANIIRGELAFSGLLMSDDICMKALDGPWADRTAAALEAGCDVVLHCSGDLPEMQAVADCGRRLTESGIGRLAAAMKRVDGRPVPDIQSAQRELDEIFAKSEQ